MDDEIDLPKRMLFDWKKTLIYLVPALAIAGILVAKIGTRSGRAEGDFISATNAFTKWEQILDKEAEELVSLEKVIKKHPELRAHYDTLIGQSFLAAKSPKDAEPYIDRALKRTAQPYYSDYAHTSLLVSREKYEEALEKAQALKEKMVQDRSFWEKGRENSTLFAFNLMRIATLCLQLEDREGESQAWKEIKRYGGWDTEEASVEMIGHEGFRRLLSHFTVQETSLLDYITAREEELSNP